MDTHALRVLEFDAIRQQLAALTACSLGRERAAAMTPSDYLPDAQARLDETTECRALMDVKGNLPLGGVTDVRPLLRQAEIGQTLDPHGLLDVLGVAQASRALKAFLQKLAPEYPLMADKAGGLGQFPSLEAEIGISIGPNAQVLDSASPELARIRSQRKVTSQRMLDKLNAIVGGSLRTLLQDPVIVQRGDRYCVPVKAEHRGAFGGIVHDTSASGATLFMEPQSVVDLGNEMKELAIKEEQEVARILARLTESVRRVGVPLLVATETLGEIDFIAARAKLAQQHRAVEPELNRNGLTRLLSARHPLIDPNLVVAIDVELGTPQNKVLLITGPNTGGKTVSLKTTGLLTLMAQCGLHVPASRAEMNVFDQVFADIGDEQSLQQSLSTFSGHISNIVRILQNLNHNALVLLDEVGAGTDPGEGAALARAILDHLRARDARVIATTHYGELKTYAFTTEGVQNASVEFDEATLAPTYRLLQGIPGSSNAFAIAGRLGIPDSVIGDARRALTGSDETADLLRELEENRRKAVMDAREAERARVEAQMLRRRYNDELTALETLRREARQAAEAEARALIKRAQDKFDNVLAEVRRASHEGKHTERARQAIKDIGRDLQSAVRRRNEDEQAQRLIESVPDRPLRRGDRVRITSLGTVGELLEDARDDSPLPVQVGAMRVSVPPSSLRLLGEEGKAPPAPNSGGAREDKAAGFPAPPELGAGGRSEGDSQPGVSIRKAMNITPQLTLLGQRADEAVQNVEKYLDDAYAAGLTRARLVHGKGTGALRRAVQEYLDGHPLVSAYATADPEEGGAGATVVTLKET
ncbi:MAG: endonuclease MutS2 [Armatimonadetes bacterium]|nr:endonuclease MutS2 [Armatimonadota bacterium]